MPTLFWAVRQTLLHLSTWTLLPIFDLVIPILAANAEVLHCSTSRLRQLILNKNEPENASLTLPPEDDKTMGNSVSNTMTLTNKKFYLSFSKLFLWNWNLSIFISACFSANQASMSVKLSEMKSIYSNFLKISTKHCLLRKYWLDHPRILTKT